MKIVIWLKNTSLPNVFEHVVNTYQEEQLFCVQQSEKITKYPLISIFRIEEDIEKEPQSVQSVENKRD